MPPFLKAFGHQGKGSALKVKTMDVLRQMVSDLKLTGDAKAQGSNLNLTERTEFPLIVSMPAQARLAIKITRCEDRVEGLIAVVLNPFQDFDQ